MADFLHDDIVWNILARLPAKTLLRFRRVSAQWNCMVSEPNFMKFRSRKTIILPLFRTLRLIDDNAPIDDVPNSVVSRYPLENLLGKQKPPKFIGTHNGIVLLTYSCNLILYNPFTRAFSELPCPSSVHASVAFGLGHGVNSDVLKLVKFTHHFRICNVFNFKESSWSSLSTTNNRILVNTDGAGHFVNVFLYWIESNRNMLIVLNVNSMMLSKMNLPFKYLDRQRTMNGCLLH